MTFSNLRFHSATADSNIKLAPSFDCSRISRAVDRISNLKWFITAKWGGGNIPHVLTSYEVDEKGKETLVRYKLRSITNKANQRLEPPGGGWGLFGWHTVPPDAKEIVITEGMRSLSRCKKITLTMLL
jgi:hypothetical protein